MDPAIKVKVAVLGAGGLGRAACRIIGMKRELRLVAICDSKGFVASPEGLPCERLASASGDLVSSYVTAESGTSSDNGHGGERALSTEALAKVDTTALTAVRCDDPLRAIAEWEGPIDAVLVTLPNMPNEFIPTVVQQFVQRRPQTVVVDVLKRTAAVEQMFALDPLVKEAHSVVLTGCGATPGLLTAAAVLAAQSFIHVERVDIWWGVGMANWDAYQATIREDIAHVPGYSVERAKAMTDQEIEAFLDTTGGLLELHQMEHADDILLERSGVVESQDQVEVGGVMDTRHQKKPVSTTMTLTGVTFEGKRSSHRFILGDDTSMAANVIGPALGYLKRGGWLKAQGIFGVFGSTEFLPMVVR